VTAAALGGGAYDASAYRAWIEKFAQALGDSNALVILEPDAVAHIVDGCTPGEYHAEREQLLSEAIVRLKHAAPHKGVPGRRQPRLDRRAWKLVERCNAQGSPAPTASP